MSDHTTITAEINKRRLSAALEDAEGHALVAAILNPDNPRLVRNNRKHMDGEAEVIGAST